MEKEYEEEELRRMRREQRRREIRRSKKQQQLFQRMIAAGTFAVILTVLLIIAAGRMGKEEAGQKESSREDMAQESPAAEKQKGRPETEADKEQEDAEEEPESGSDAAETEKGPYRFQETEDTIQPGEEIVSTNAILVDVEKKTILAGRNEKERTVPASMTKVLTLLVAVENIEDLDETYTVRADAAEYALAHDCSSAGFEKEETVTIRDLLYGAILPSGADAALSLAVCVSGSQEAFVEKMNGKLEELGLSGTAHFTNCVGIYEEDHYCSLQGGIVCPYLYDFRNRPASGRNPSVQLVFETDRGQGYRRRGSVRKDRVCGSVRQLCSQLRKRRKRRFLYLRYRECV